MLTRNQNVPRVSSRIYTYSYSLLGSHLEPLNPYLNLNISGLLRSYDRGSKNTQNRFIIPPYHMISFHIMHGLTSKLSSRRHTATKLRTRWIHRVWLSPVEELCRKVSRRPNEVLSACLARSRQRSSNQCPPAPHTPTKPRGKYLRPSLWGCQNKRCLPTFCS